MTIDDQPLCHPGGSPRPIGSIILLTRRNTRANSWLQNLHGYVFSRFLFVFYGDEYKKLVQKMVSEKRDCGC